MKNIVLTYILSLLSFLLVDIVWLTKIAPRLYRSHIGHLMADKAMLLPALLFYLIFITGLVVFVILPSLSEGSLASLISKAALFGLVTYATFDLTNQAVLKNWPLSITLIDIAWGMFITTTSSIIVFIIAKNYIN